MRGFSLHRTAAVVFRLFIVVSLWEGPILWGHQHAAEAAGLTEHLARFHHGEPCAAGHGWHWHLSLPGDATPGASEDSPVSPRPVPRSLPGPLLTADAMAGDSAPDNLTFAALVFTAGSQGQPRATEVDARDLQRAGRPVQQWLCRLSC